jgi:hypothetical protein
MVSFLDWLIVKDTEGMLWLLESAAYFQPTDYNPVFDGELAKLAQSHDDPDVQKQIEALRGFDFGNYLRTPGEPLWPAFKSAADLEIIRQQDPRAFAALYQQNPDDASAAEWAPELFGD